MTGCMWCKRKRPLKVYRVRARRPHRGWSPTELRMVEMPPLPIERRMLAQCFDSADCRAYMRRRREKQERRTGRFVLAEPKAPGAPRGICNWCGEKIALAPGVSPRYAARQYHRGDEMEATDIDCLTEWHRSYCWSARDAVWLRGDRECVDCGRTFDDRASDWAADHRVPLADGGENTLENLQLLCTPCHRDKTAREARERAERRKVAA